MNLYFTGHGEKYAVEQTLLTLFPQERPVYPDTPPGGDNELERSFSRGKTWCTAGKGEPTPASAGCRPASCPRTTRW